MKYLPEWLDPAEDLFVHGDEWRTLYALGVDPGWPETWQRGLMSLLLDEPMAGGGYATPEGDIVKLVSILHWTGLRLDGKPRQGKSAEIAASIKAQLVEWLEEPDGPEKYPSPYSVKQWRKLIRGRFSGYGACKERAARICRQLEADSEAGGDIWPSDTADLVPVLPGGKVERKAKSKPAPNRHLEPAPGCTPLGLRPMGKDPEAARAVREYQEKQEKGPEHDGCTCTAQVCFEYC
ncbi:MAG: hypothetical protein R6U98_06670 [Pirellulaceae bacterium]